MFQCFFEANELKLDFVMSIISGFPSNAKYTRELLNQGLIDENEATKILMFTCLF